MVYQNGEGIRRLVVELPVNVHTRFKTEVSRLGLDLRGVIIRLIESWLSGNSKIKIQPAEVNPEDTIEYVVDKILNESLDKKLDEILNERGLIKQGKTDSESPEVFEVEKVNELEEPAENSGNPDGIVEEEIQVEAVKVVRKKRRLIKRMMGIWPWIRESKFWVDEDGKEIKNDNLDEYDVDEEESGKP